MKSPYPNYELLGSLTYNGEPHNVIVYYPSDVQFTNETAAIYTELQNEIPSLLESVVYNKICNFSTTPIETDNSRLKSTKAFDITLPQSWRYTVSITENVSEYTAGRYVYYIEFNHISTRHDENSGNLLTIHVDPFDGNRQDYQFPGCEILGTTTVNGGEHIVTAVTPTDVSESEANSEEYLELSKEIPNILSSIKFKNS